MRGGSSRGLIAATALVVLACSVPTGQAFSQAATMYDFKQLDARQRLRTCVSLGTKIWGEVDVREMLMRSDAMCRCMTAFVEASPNEQAEKAAGLESTAAFCSRARQGAAGVQTVMPGVFATQG